MTENEQTKAFIADLRAVLKKHGVTFMGFPEYGGMDNYVGMSYTFSRPSDSPEPIFIEINEIEKLLQ